MLLAKCPAAGTRWGRLLDRVLQSGEAQVTHEVACSGEAGMDLLMHVSNSHAEQDAAPGDVEKECAIDGRVQRSCRQMSRAGGKDRSAEGSYPASLFTWVGLAALLPECVSGGQTVAAAGLFLRDV